MRLKGEVGGGIRLKKGGGCIRLERGGGGGGIRLERGGGGGV